MPESGIEGRDLDPFTNLFSSASLILTAAGLSSVCCILPQEAIFHYHIGRISQVASAVLKQAASMSVAGASGADSTQLPPLVFHSFSNNGAIVYQQCYQLLAQRQQLDRIQVRLPTLLFIH